MADKPTLRDLTSDGASVRRVVEYVSDRLRVVGTYAVTVEFSTSYGWTGSIALSTGVLLKTGCEMVPGMAPIDTLVRLLDELDKLIDGYLTEHTPDSEVDGG